MYTRDTCFEAQHNITKQLDESLFPKKEVTIKKIS